MNKTRTIKQLQLRLFSLFLVLFISTQLGYRFFVERPNIQETLTTIIEDDIFELQSAAKREFETLEHFTYDFVNSSYFLPLLNRENQVSLEDVVEDIIYKEIPAHAMIVLDEHLKPIYTEPLDYGLHLLADFKWADIQGNLKAFTVTPNQTTRFNANAPNARLGNVKSGLINTQQGIAFFSSRSIRDISGKQIGYIVLLRLIDEVYLNELAAETHTNLNILDIPAEFDISEFFDWRDVRPFVPLTPVNLRVIRDIYGEPIGLLEIEHLNGVMPPWLGFRFIFFTLSFSLILFATNMFFTRRVSKPINSLSEKVKSMTQNEKFEHIAINSKIIELNEFIKNFNALTKKVKEQTALLNEQAFIDPLTQIANRRSFDLHLENQIQLLVRHQISFCLIMADVDHFKRYNDSAGHQAGDTALINIANFLSSYVKRNNDTCARYGGEEFVLIYSDVSYSFVDERLKSMIEELEKKAYPHLDSPTSDYITISMGACIISADKPLPYETLSANTIIELADKALYQAKAQGRNQAVIKKYPD